MYKTIQAAVLLALTAAASGQVTESPVTVAPGRFLLEMDALSLTFDREADRQYTAIGAATTFLTTGLTARLDLQLGAEIYLRTELDSTGVTDSRSGIGDVYVRAKYRFYESEDTYTMVAVLPYVKVPTNSGGVGNDAVEGGVIIPVSTELNGGFAFAAMGELAYRRNDTDDGYDAYWFASVEVTRRITRAIAIYAEALAGKSSGASGWEGTLGAGATLHLTTDCWLDYAIYGGISDQAPDWTHVLRFNLGF